MRSVYDCGHTSLTMAVFYQDLADYIRHRIPGLTVERGANDEIVLHTGYYSWSDGTVRDYPER